MKSRLVSFSILAVIYLSASVAMGQEHGGGSIEVKKADNPFEKLEPEIKTRNSIMNRERFGDLNARRIINRAIIVNPDDTSKNPLNSREQDKIYGPRLTAVQCRALQKNLASLDDQLLTGSSHTQSVEIDDQYQSEQNLTGNDLLNPVIEFDIVLNSISAGSSLNIIDTPVEGLINVGRFRYDRSKQEATLNGIQLDDTVGSVVRDYCKQTIEEEN